MNKRLRPIPYPVCSERRRKKIEAALRYGWAKSYREAVAYVAAANERARNTPLPGERCEAKTGKGTPCQCKALANGRCKLHGGKSTGPKTAEGKMKSAANLPITASQRSARVRHGVSGAVTRVGASWTQAGNPPKGGDVTVAGNGVRSVYASP